MLDESQIKDKLESVISEAVMTTSAEYQFSQLDSLSVIRLIVELEKD
jgi:acyl carrier protein